MQEHISSCQKVSADIAMPPTRESVEQTVKQVTENGIEKQAAMDIKKRLRTQARKQVEARKGEAVHHINTLDGHPLMAQSRPIKWLPGIPKNANSLFPTMGFPFLANASWNLAKISEHSTHLVMHQVAYNAELLVGFSNQPFFVITRGMKILYDNYKPE